MQPGCIYCQINQDTEEPNVIFYQEQWQSWGDIEKNIQSDRFSWILELMELSTTTPELQFCGVQETRGMEYVRKIRKTKNI